MTGRLLLVRHGETEGNVARRLDTALPGAPLTATGERQARELGERLATRPLRVLVSSRALRARQTAAHLAAATGVAVEVVDGLHEVQAGDLEGLSDDGAHETFKTAMQAWFSGDLSARTPGGESGREVQDRFLPVVERLRARYLTEGDVVLVAHGTAIRLAAIALAPLPARFAAEHHLPNTGVVELVPVGDGWECAGWGGRLPPFGAADALIPGR